MLADFEFRFSQHDDTVRRAEANARLREALAGQRPATDDHAPRRLTALLRRLAGTAATAA